MLVVFETVVNKFGPWVICFAMIGVFLYEAHRHEETLISCLLYTSDAADE